MKPNMKWGAAALATLLFAACAQKAEDYVAESASSVDMNADADLSKVEKFIHKRTFVRTADWKFKVKDTRNAANFVEDVTKNFGGFVILNDQTSDVSQTKKTQLTSDSMLVSTYFTPVTYMTIRVPNEFLDTTLRAINALVEYQDSKKVKADDVSLSFLENKLTQERSAKHGQRLKVDVENDKVKTSQTIEAENVIADKDAASDQALVSNLSLMDQVNYSTISLEMYQQATVHREMVSTYKDLSAFEPSFFYRIWESIQFGWRGIEEVIVMLTRGWVLLLLLGAGIWIYRRKFVLN